VPVPPYPTTPPVTREHSRHHYGSGSERGVFGVCWWNADKRLPVAGRGLRANACDVTLRVALWTFASTVRSSRFAYPFAAATYRALVSQATMTRRWRGGRVLTLPTTCRGTFEPERWTGGWNWVAGEAEFTLLTPVR